MKIGHHYIHPLTDYGFKRLFGTEANKDLLIHFLRQVLPSQEKILDLDFLNNEQLGKAFGDRNALFDVHCKNTEDEHFVIEVQHVKQEYFKDRSIYYATFPLRDQAYKGKNWDFALKPLYTIGILNFEIPNGREPERYIRHVQLADVHSCEVFFDRLTFIYIEIPRFNLKKNVMETNLEKWMYVLKNLHTLKEKPASLNDPIFDKLFQEAEIAQLNPQELEQYEASLKKYRDEYSIRETALKEGKAEREITIAKIMKSRGYPYQEIMDLTGLDLSSIENL